MFFGFLCLWTFVNVFRIGMNMSISRVRILVVYFWTWICYSRSSYIYHGIDPSCSFKARFFLDDAALCPVVRHSRPTVVASCTVCSGVFHHWIHHLWPQGAVPPGFNPLRRGWVYRPAPEAPRKGECRRGPRHFWNCLSCWASALRQDPP